MTTEKERGLRDKMVSVIADILPERFNVQAEMCVELADNTTEYTDCTAGDSLVSDLLVTRVYLADGNVMADCRDTCFKKNLQLSLTEFSEGNVESILRAVLW